MRPTTYLLSNPYQTSNNNKKKKSKILFRIKITQKRHQPINVSSIQIVPHCSRFSFYSDSKRRCTVLKENHHMNVPNNYIGGKAARAKAARNGIVNGTNQQQHAYYQQNKNENGITVEQKETDESNRRTHAILEELEKQERIKFYPHLLTRKEIPMDNHGTMIVPSSDDAIATASNCTQDKSTNWDLTENGLRGEWSIEHTMIPCSLLTVSNLIYLDLSRNELWGLPSPNSMKALANLESLNLSRNWFEDLPISIGVLQNLKSLNASHNMLHSTPKALLLVPVAVLRDAGLEDDDAASNKEHYENVNCKESIDKGYSSISILRSLRHLAELNLEFNNKCNHQKLRDKVEKELHNQTSCKLRMTINLPPKPREKGYFVGESAAVRDPTLLRSQLECWSTTKLRRRLVADFGQEPLPEGCGRSHVMDQLLTLYSKEYVSQHGDTTEIMTAVDPQRQRGMRKIIRTNGCLIEDAFLLDNLLLALKEWKNNWTNKNNERTAIDAENYMILTSPASWVNLGHHKRRQAQAKLEANQTLWDLAKQAMASVDAPFSERYTALAVTHNFIGSPHIDRQNVGPFYGLSLGDFDDGSGGIMVECSTRIVAHNNTKNRLAKVDGRFPHWVAPYDSQNKERFSVIFYQTMGVYQKIETSVFNLSEEDYE